MQSETTTEYNETLCRTLLETPIYISIDWHKRKREQLVRKHSAPRCRWRENGEDGREHSEDDEYAETRVRHLFRRIQQNETLPILRPYLPIGLCLSVPHHPGLEEGCTEAWRWIVTRPIGWTRPILRVRQVFACAHHCPDSEPATTQHIRTH